MLASFHAPANRIIRVFALSVLVSSFSLILLPGPASATQEVTGSSPSAQEAGSKPETKPLLFNSKEDIKKERARQLDMTSLHRLDFRVQGSSCAACLGRIRKRVDKLKGVYEVAVCIKAPYGAAVVYDSTKLDKDKILSESRKDEKTNVIFLDVEDLKIEKPPFILVPKHSAVKAANN